MNQERDDTSDSDGSHGMAYDIDIIRPEVRSGAVRHRGEGMTRARLAAIRKGLRAFHTLELMAQTIYRFQLSGRRTELERALIAAMENEMTHYQDFQVKLCEFGMTPSPVRWAYWLVGFVFGYGSRLMGRRQVLRTGIWVETKAVHHYAELLGTIEWDDETRAVIEKNGADEQGHIDRWRGYLAGE